MKAAWRSALLLIMTIPLLSGCGNKTTATGVGGSSGSAEDRAQVANQLAENPQYVDDGLYENTDETAVNESSSSTAISEAVMNAIQPLRFSRHINHVTRSYEFAFSDSDSTGRPTRAVVTVNKTLTGTFNILYAAPGDSAFRLRVVRKPLEDHWVRRILLFRGSPRDSDDDHQDSAWHIAGLSGVVVTSANASTHIVSLRIQAAALDTTVTDPLAFFRIRRVLRFDAPDSVTLTVTTLRNDDVVVLQHRDRKFRLHNNGDNTYTGVFRARFLASVQHAGVNALSNGTLYDDSAPYDSQAWLLPYVAARRGVDLALR